MAKGKFGFSHGNDGDGFFYDGDDFAFGNFNAGFNPGDHHHDGHPGPDHVLLVGANSQYHTIQSAVDAAHSGDTIVVAGGTYAEQVSVVGSGKDGLTITAADGDTVVITAPTTLVKTADAANTGRDIVGLVTVDGADNVTIKGVTVDGDHRGADVPGGDDPTLVGVAFVNADDGVIDHVHVTGIRESDAGFGNQRGVGIYVTNDDPSPGLPHTPSAAEANALNSITIEHSTVDDFQKGGIVVSYADVDIEHNTVTGIGGTTWTAQNGIQVSNSTGSVDHNDISAIGFTGGNWGASGLLAFQDRGLVIDHNTITGTGSADGVIGIYQLDTVGGQITHNTISNVGYGIDAEDYPTAWGYPDALLPGTGGSSSFDYSSNTLSSIGYNAIWFQPDAATTAVFKVTGTAGNDVIFGAAGNDVLDGGKGDDYLAGNGGNDKFVFDKSSGHDEIGDFGQTAGNRDLIDVSDYHFKSFAQLLPKISDDSSGNAVIHLTGQDSITLDGIHTAQLTVHDFII